MWVFSVRAQNYSANFIIEIIEGRISRMSRQAFPELKNGTKVVSEHQVAIIEVQDMAGKSFGNTLADKTRNHNGMQWVQMNI